MTPLFQCSNSFYLFPIELFTTMGKMVQSISIMYETYLYYTQDSITFKIVHFYFCYKVLLSIKSSCTSFEKGYFSTALD